MPRKEKKFHFIYKTTNTLTGKYYIGMHSTDVIDDGYLGSGKRLRYSVRKYGAENHKREILEFVETREKLRAREAEVVSLDEIAKEDCMNLIIGGEGGGGLSGEKHYQSFIEAGMNNFYKTKEKREQTLSEKRQNPEWLSQNRDRVSEALKNRYASGAEGTFKGKTHTDETKRKMSNAKKGKGTGSNNSQFGTCWITRNSENKKIKKTELEEYIRLGWNKGRKTNNGV